MSTAVRNVSSFCDLSTTVLHNPNAQCSIAETHPAGQCGLAQRFDDVPHVAEVKAPIFEDLGDDPCELCGAPVIQHHCKRICFKCGFTTGCSEGI